MSYAVAMQTSKTMVYYFTLELKKCLRSFAIMYTLIIHKQEKTFQKRCMVTVDQ